MYRYYDITVTINYTVGRAFKKRIDSCGVNVLEGVQGTCFT